MTADVLALGRLLDREAICDLLLRYCRGVDRRDPAMLERIYWPDAVDDHVHVRLSGPDYVAHVLRATADMRTAHHLTNILITFDDPDVARSEAYFLGLHEMPGEGAESGSLMFVMLSGRYLDRMERRNGEWRIAYRTLVFDMQQTLPAGAWTDGWLARIARRGQAWPDDPLYAL